MFDSLTTTLHTQINAVITISININTHVLWANKCSILLFLYQIANVNPMSTRLSKVNKQSMSSNQTTTLRVITVILSYH